MPITISGSTGIAGVDGSASTPAVQGTDTNTGIFFPAADTIAFGEGGSEAMRIDSSGNVGIGTSSPGALLQLNKGSGAADFRLSVAGTLYGNIYASSSDMTINSVTAIPLTFGTNNTERMRIDSSGNVGIGTSAPGAKLEVIGNIKINGYNIIGGANNSSVGMFAGTAFNTGGASIVTRGISNGYNDGGIEFYTGSGATGSERARIDSSGNLLVGTTSTLFASSHAFVNSGTAVLGLRNSLSTAGKYWQVGPDSNSSFKVYNQSSVGMFLSDGSTSWASSSDERQKNIIEPISDATNKVASLRAVIGSYKNDETNKRRSFLIAQDVQQVLPEAVTEAPDGFLGVAYSDVIPLLVAAIQELKADNDAMKERIATLEAK